MTDLTKASTLPAPSETETASELAETGESEAVSPTLLGATEEAPTLRDRMRVRSQTPEFDNIFVPQLDFPGVVVRPGAYHERSFAVARECRVSGVRLPKGLTVVRIILRVGPRFGPAPEADVPRRYSVYQGEDARIFEGDAIREGGWKRERLAPESLGSIYILVRNDAEDDRRFEGTILFQEDRVPEPEHQEL